jgi:uncharacterized protein involved in exopolysaccharide biosynthesis
MALQEQQGARPDEMDELIALVEPEDPPEPESPAREIVAILARGKWIVLVVFLGVTGLATWATLSEAPLFEAESSLMVRIGREYIYRPEVGRTETTRTPSLAEMVNSEVEILSSRDLAEQVVRELGHEKLYPELAELVSDPRVAAEMAVLRFRKAASIRPVLESSVIKVGFEHEVPQLAADAVNLLVERFKDKHVEVFGEERAGRLESQLEGRVEQLAAAEGALAEFKRANGVFDLAAQRNLLLARRERLEQALQTTESELAGLRLRAGPESQEELPEVPELPPHLRPEMKDELLRQRYELELSLRGFEPPVSDRLAEQAAIRLLDLELEERNLLRDYSPTNRKVQSVREEIQRVRTFLEQAESRAGGFDEARREEQLARSQEISTEIAHLTSEIELLVREEELQLRLEARRSIQVLENQRDDNKTRLASVEAEIRRLDQFETPLRKLQRELDMAEAAAQTYREQVDEARITDELDREKRINVRVIEKAAAPVAPIGLPRDLKLLVGAMVGLVAGIGAAVLLDLFRAR